MNTRIWTPLLTMTIFAACVISSLYTHANAQPATQQPAPVRPPPRPGTQLPAPDLLPSAPVGVIEGMSEITASGEYRYTIPLQAPRGRAGIEPSLSLQYASRAGDGHLGVGWNLVGL